MALNRPNHRPPKTRVIDPADMTEAKYFTIYEVADLLKLHHNTIRKMIKSGELPAQQFGRVWRISREDLNQYLTNNKSM